MRGRPWADSQVVRVQSELVLGSLADWLAAGFSTTGGQEAVRRKSREPGGVTPGLHFPSPYTRAAVAGSGSQPIQHTGHELPALNLSTPSPQFLTKVLVKAVSQAQDGDIWRAGGGGKMKPEESAQIPDCSPHHPFPNKGRTGRREWERRLLPRRGRGWGLPAN